MQAFAHIDGLAEHVMAGRYDLMGPDKEIIMPNYWESTIEPDMHITMMMWPVPEPKKEEEIPIPPDVDADAILNLDEILNPKKEKKGRCHSLLYAPLEELSNIQLSFQQEQNERSPPEGASRIGCWEGLPAAPRGL